MKNNFLFTALSTAIAVGASASAGNVVAAEGLPLTINGASCGKYTSLVLDKTGHLQLDGILGCLAGGGDTGGGDTGGGDTGGGDTGGGDTGGGDTGGGENTACGPIPSGVIARNDHVWNEEIGANVRTPTILKPTEVFSLKINKPAGVVGYGSLSTINTTSIAGMRTTVVSECPGSMVPVSDKCKVVGMEDKLAWSFNSTVPQGFNMCRLDPGKNYYINIKHTNAAGNPSCFTSQCYFAFEYKAREIK